ncbi:methylmalonyl-CoA mutase small subunit [Streptomyces griseocarneus]|uniref:methylmalonyl-CoA mutase small subunit n=1 Tax=Streptomyces griseocarneus TaxID=51201 RepID=UPI00167DDA1A|nr:methylmalonyl-CoA mutase small subunit [Streptomyces griseocarneus]MBZ6476338.1 methylmalonyl-CoA mutase small subunit [Streptomyces griseocarneus]GHG78103.1 methylmalonyl-CoA mutase [Streptomyces griseocarneus]
MTVLPDDGFHLAAEFPDATREQWQRLVEGVLSRAGTAAEGPAAEDALATALQDGLATRPLYTADDAGGAPGLPGFPPFVRGGRTAGTAIDGWDVRQHHGDPDPRRANEAVLADLENGVTSLWLTVGSAGLPADALPAALDGVYLDLAPVVLDAGAEFETAARHLLALHDERGLPRGAARGNLGADPLGVLARTGGADDPAGPLAAAARLAVTCAADRPGIRAVTVDALPYHEAGASPAQELGCSLATGVAYLRALTDAGLSVDEACAQLEFRYAATADQFLTIATLRAARRLWARVAEVSGARGPAAAQRQHAVTSPVMMTRRDPWVNMLRTTLACLGAGVGGADAVTVLPFDEALGLPDAFARRIARNTSSILLEESHLARVVDPAGGSWYVERLTDELAHAAWAWFQEIERAGGQAAALRSGLVAERLAATWQSRSADLATRREPITGVSEFPHLGERPLHREPAPAAPAGGLPKVRRDEAYEALRARSDAHLAATGTRPRVLLATLGPAAAHTARATFAANLFRAGGIEPLAEPVTAETAAAALAGSGATLVCLCSSDALYADQADAVAAALKAAGAGRVLLAGRPAGEQREAHRRAGVDEFVFAGCDAVAVLSSALDQMGVA